MNTNVKTKIEENEKFFHNPLIQKIKDEKYWTVSDKMKRPLDANELNKGEFKLASFQDGNPLVSLTELQNNKNLIATNRAYWLHSKENHVIALDIEKTATPEFKKMLLKLPCDYAETSMSGLGIHMLIEIPNEAIDESSKYLFNEISVLKTPNKDLEIVFNNHFITLTKQQITFIRREETNKNHTKQLARFLSFLVEMDEKNKEKRKKAKELKASLTNTDELSDFGKLLIHRLKEIDFNKTPENYNNDLSSYEIGMAVFYAGQIEKIIKNIVKDKNTKYLKNDAKNFTDEESILVVYNILSEKLDYREKHDEFRDGMPWLMYRAKDGVSYILSNKK